MFGLKNEQIEAMNACFEKYPEIDLVIIYGSRARGNYKYNSDIDLAIIANTENYKSTWKVENDLDDLLMPYKIDLSLLTELDSPELVAHIHKVGKVLYDRKAKLVMSEPPVDYSARKKG